MSDNKEIEILIVPSSDDEKMFEECANFKEALKLKGEAQAARVFSFKTKREAKAFLEGYNAGVGYLGSGMWFSSIEL